jgi:hypothetical protein
VVPFILKMEMKKCRRLLIGPKGARFVPIFEKSGNFGLKILQIDKNLKWNGGRASGVDLRRRGELAIPHGGAVGVPRLFTMGGGEGEVPADSSFKKILSSDIELIGSIYLWLGVMPYG